MKPSLSALIAASVLFPALAYAQSQPASPVQAQTDQPTPESRSPAQQQQQPRIPEAPRGSVNAPGSASSGASGAGGSTASGSDAPVHDQSVSRRWDGLGSTGGGTGTGESNGTTATPPIRLPSAGTR